MRHGVRFNFEKKIAITVKNIFAAKCSTKRHFAALCGKNVNKDSKINILQANFSANPDYPPSGLPSAWKQADAGIERYLAALDRADREDSDLAEAKTTRIKDKINGLHRQMLALNAMEQQVQAAPDNQVSLTDPDARLMATSGRGHGHSRSSPIRTHPGVAEVDLQLPAD